MNARLQKLPKKKLGRFKIIEAHKKKYEWMQAQ
jgi:hypothetical protein